MKFDSITSAEVATIKSTVRELGVTDSVSGVSTLKVDKVDLSLNADGELSGTIDADGRIVPVADIISNASALPVTVGVPATNNLRKALATVARYRGFARHISRRQHYGETRKQGAQPRALQQGRCDFARHSPRLRQL